MTDEWTEKISERYIELFEKLTGEKFLRADTTGILKRVEENVLKSLTDYGFKSDLNPGLYRDQSHK